MNFNGKQNIALLNSLSEILVRHDFLFIGVDKSRTDIATWEKKLTPTLSATMMVTLSSTLSPDLWSIEPLIILYSSFAAEKSNYLGLDRDCSPVTDRWIEPDSVPIMRLFPAHYRCQDKLEIKYPVLEGRPDNLAFLAQEFSDVYDEYALPVLTNFSNSLSAAEFLLTSSSLYKTRRLSTVRPRYDLLREPIYAAILFLEAGEFQRSLDLLKRWDTCEEMFDPSFTAQYKRSLVCQIKKLIPYFESQLSKRSVRSP